MDVNVIAAIVTATTAALTTLTAAYLVTLVMLDPTDARSYCKPCARLYSIRSSQFKLADANDSYNDGWFCKTL